MESLFPYILFLGPYAAPIVIRVAIAAVFLYDGWAMWKSNVKWPSVVWFIFGILIGVGFLTQLVVILAAAHIILLSFIMKGSSSVFKSNITAILALAMLISLFVTGPGGLAFDLPY